MTQTNKTLGTPNDVNATIPSSSVSISQPTQGRACNYAIPRVVDELAEAAESFVLSDVRSREALAGLLNTSVQLTPPYWRVNNPRLWDLRVAMLRRNDKIEGSKSNDALNAKL
jgi:hypothetical protein